MRSKGYRAVEIREDVHRRLEKLRFETGITIKRLASMLLSAALEDDAVTARVLEKLRKKERNEESS